MKKVFFILIMAACAGAAATACAFADSPGRLVSKGNREYRKKAYAKALDLYDKASVKAPESAIAVVTHSEPTIAIRSTIATTHSARA